MAKKTELDIVIERLEAKIKADTLTVLSLQQQRDELTAPKPKKEKKERQPRQSRRGMPAGPETANQTI